MNNELMLTPRLKAAADMVGVSPCVADVGTDHGYIPVYLALTGRAERIVASDINEAPLESARRNAGRSGVSDRIEFIRADGLAGMEDIGLEAAVIAGMGGETIAAILKASPWVREQRVRLVLQPMTKLGFLSNWLDDSGYAIRDEVLVRDAGRIYAVLLAEAGMSRAPLSCAQIYADRILLEKRDPLLPEYLDGLIASFERRLAGMDRAKEEVRVDLYDHTALALKGFLKMKEETEKW